MQHLLEQVQSNNLIRCRGALDAVRSCIFEDSVHHWLICEVDILRFLLMPLVRVSAEEFTEQEKVGMHPSLLEPRQLLGEAAIKDRRDLIVMTLECFILLFQRRRNREELRKRKVYPIARNVAIEMGDCDEVTAVVDELVQLLMRDEEPVPVTLPVTGTGPGSVDRSVATSSSSSSLTGSGGNGGKISAIINVDEVD